MTPRLLILAVVLALFLIAFCHASDLAHEPEQSLTREAPVVTWGSVRPPYVIEASMFTTTTTARARTAPTERTTMRAASAGVSDETWDRIAACESGQRWDDTRGGYEGGLHFAHDTWVRAGGRQFAEHAYQASREQQIQVANSWLARTSWAQWPACSRKLGLR